MGNESKWHPDEVALHRRFSDPEFWSLARMLATERKQQRPRWSGFLLFFSSILSIVGICVLWALLA